MATGVEWRGPSPSGSHRYPRAAEVNPLLISTFAGGRAALERLRGVESGAPFFASDDDLLDRVKLPEWQDFVSFVVSGIGATAEGANAEQWHGQVANVQVGFQGMWFQVSRDGAFHDIHTHGNCSWSGVYIVQIDGPERRVSHPVYGAANGVTRLYGPPFAALGGAFIDIGNAYLQPPHQDIEPVAGQLLLFPSWLAHQAMPYGGESDRIIVSFNASVHASEGDQIHGYSAH